MKSKNFSSFAVLVCLVCMALANALVFYFWNSSYILNDGAQYLSTAFNWLEGQGFSTNALMFTPHYQGTLPAPQTVWPPAYPVLIALSSFFGVQIDNAALMVNLTFHAISAWLLIMIFRRWGIPFFAAMLFSLAFYFTAISWVYAVGLLSEPVFNTFVLAAILLLPNPDNKSLWLWIASGFFIALSVATRYSGVFFAAGVGLGMFAYCLVTYRTDSRRLLHCIGLLLLQQSMAIFVFAAMQFRTYSLTGTLARQAGSKEPESLALTIGKIIWQVKELLGFSDSGMLPNVLTKLLFLAFLILVLCVLALTLFAFLKTPRTERKTDTDYATIAWYVILAHSFVFMLFFIISSMGSNNVDLTHRYLYQIYVGLYILFCVIAFAAFNRYRSSHLSKYWKPFSALLVLLCTVFAIAQANSASGIRHSASLGKNTQAILTLPVTDELQLSDMIEQCFPGSDQTALSVGTSTFGAGSFWSNEGQQLHLHIGVPALAISEVYANEPYDVTQMAEQISTYNIKMFVFVHGARHAGPKFVSLMDELKQWLVSSGTATRQPLLEDHMSDSLSADVYVVDQSCAI